MAPVATGGDSSWPASTLLGRLEHGARDALLAAGRTVRFASGSYLLRQGETGSYVLLLLEGVVKVMTGTEDGFEGLLGLRVGGDLIGEMGALDGDPRSASVVAGTVVRARLIDQAELRRVWSRHPDLQTEAIHVISERLRRANERYIRFRTLGAATRVCLLLVELAERCGRPTPQGCELILRLTQGELASLAGVALPTIEKALHSLAHDGLVLRQYRHITIRDLDLLRARCNVHTKPTSRNPYQDGIAARGVGHHDSQRRD